MIDLPAEILVIGLLAVAHWAGDRTESRLLRRRTAPPPTIDVTHARWRPSPRTYTRTTTPAPRRPGA